MSPEIEKRLLQVVIAIACLVPLSAGALGILHGPAWLKGVHSVPADLDSHFRYMSGIFFGLGIAFASCVPAIEAKGPRFRLLSALVVAGGLSRLLGILTGPVPSAGHLFGLAMEVGVVPLLMLWQAHLARRYRAGSSPAPVSTVGK